METGRYGIHGGQYIPETLMNEIHKVEEAYEFYKNDKAFQEELTFLLNEYAGRPSLLYYAQKMTVDLDGAKVYLKREDLNHTGSHKINNVLGQVLLKQVLDNMGLRLRPLQRCLVWNVISLWEKRIQIGNHLMSIVWSY